MNAQYDSIIVGTGQAGPPLTRRLAGSGQEVAIVERKLFGGTCVNTGCIPTKAMVASAYAVHMSRRAADFGVTVGGPVAVDMKQVRSRKDNILLQSRNGLESSLKHLENCSVYEGHARFESPGVLTVGENRLTADSFFLNVGGRALVPEIPGLEETGYLTNSNMMAVDYLPRHLMILGGSYIALEFGQMFRRFGSEVTIIARGARLIEREDEDISASVKEILEAEGVSVLLSQNCTHAAKRGGDTVVTLESGGREVEVIGSDLLVATGRRPNTDDLGLDKAGIAVDRNGYIVVDDQLRTNVPGIWALGDCNGKGAFTHTSYNDFEIVAANILDGGHRRVSDRIPAYALYIDPPLGRVGMTETAARGSGNAVLVATRPMTRVGRAVEKGESQGFMKVVVDPATRLILGAAILGTGGDEAIHSILDVMYAKKPCDLILGAMHIHPTVSELIPTMLGDLKLS